MSFLFVTFLALSMVISRDVFPIVRRLAPAEYQSLLNYGSSRVRAAANAFLLRMNDMEHEGSVLFVLAMGRELVRVPWCLAVTSWLTSLHVVGCQCPAWPRDHDLQQ